MATSAAVEVQPARRRLGPMVALTGCAAVSGLAVCAAVSWVLSSDYTSALWLVPWLVAAPVLTVLLTRSTQGWIGRLMSAVVVTAACVLGAWLTWTPEPALFVGLRQQQAAANAVAENALAGTPRGTCRPASNGQLGPLDGFGPWSEVCAYAAPNLSAQGVNLKRPIGSDAPALVYVVAGGAGSGCIRHISGNWWALRSRSADPSHPCPRQYTYIPAG
ncbi:MAG: hypothetical protein ACXVGR_14330 [Mycobacteriaceae bacterium]